ncbi:MAG: hypothetical protein ACLRWL_10310 [Evtepia gabavorous]
MASGIAAFEFNLRKALLGPVPVRAGSVGGSNFGTVSCKTCSGCAPGVFGITLLVFSHEYGPATIADLAGEDASSAAARAALEANLVWTSPFPSATCCG